MRILVAEDDKDMQKIIYLYLKKEGYEIEVASDGKQAFERLCQENFDLVILDWMMPNMDGISVCKAIKEYKIPTKIIMLTAKIEIENEIKGLSYGADDYIRKPFEPKILLLRIKKILRVEQELSCGNITLNQETQIVKNGEQEVKLGKKEFDLLRVLLLNRGMILSRTQLLDKVWGMDYMGDERTVDTHIRRLRSKLGSKYIVTHVGLGYAMVDVHE